MDVMTAARSIGLVSDGHGTVSGTIEEARVLAVISELVGAHPGNDDVLADASKRVQLARSAGVMHPDPTSAMRGSNSEAAVQLRYRSEMADIFTDLAIDIGLRDVQVLADAPA
jgi:hypothetical protein